MRFEYMCRYVLRGQDSLTGSLLIFTAIFGDFFFDRVVARDYCVAWVSVIIFRIYSAQMRCLLSCS